jgi:hypothetical protein
LPTFCVRCDETSLGSAGWWSLYPRPWYNDQMVYELLDQEGLFLGASSALNVCSAVAVQKPRSWSYYRYDHVWWSISLSIQIIQQEMARIKDFRFTSIPLRIAQVHNTWVIMWTHLVIGQNKIFCRLKKSNV